MGNIDNRQKTFSALAFDYISSLPRGVEFTSVTVAGAVDATVAQIAAAFQILSRKNWIEPVRKDGQTIVFRATDFDGEEIKFHRPIFGTVRPRARGYSVKRREFQKGQSVAAALPTDEPQSAAQQEESQAVQLAAQPEEEQAVPLSTRMLELLIEIEDLELRFNDLSRFPSDALIRELNRRNGLREAS